MKAILVVTFFSGSAFFLSFFGAAAGALASGWPPSRTAKGHWTEKARRSFPPRSTASFASVFLPIGWAAGAYLAAQVLRIPAGLLAAAAALCAVAGSLIVLVALERRVRPLPPSRWRLVRGWLARIVVMQPLIPLLVVVLVLLPREMTSRAVVILAANLGLVAFAVMGGGLWLGRILGLTRPARPRLRSIVEGVSAQLGIKPRGVHEFGLSAVNAVALPLPRLIAFSESAVDLLSDEELGSITAHELGHLSESRLVGFARAGWAFLFVGALSIGPILVSYGALVSLALLATVCFAYVGFFRLAQRMEKRADTVAHSVDAKVYALALERIYELNMTPAVLPRRTTAHPDLYDRLLAAGVEPAYPRPDRPSRARQRLGLVVMLLVGLGPPWALFVILASL